MVSPAGILRRTAENKGKGQGKRVEKVGKIEGRESTQKEEASMLPGHLAEKETRSKTAPMDKRPVIGSLEAFRLHGRRGKGDGRRRGKDDFGKAPEERMAHHICMAG